MLSGVRVEWVVNKQHDNWTGTNTSSSHKYKFSTREKLVRNFFNATILKNKRSMVKKFFIILKTTKRIFPQKINSISSIIYVVLFSQVMKKGLSPITHFQSSQFPQKYHKIFTTVFRSENFYGKILIFVFSSIW